MCTYGLAQLKFSILDLCSKPTQKRSGEIEEKLSVSAELLKNRSKKLQEVRVIVLCAESAMLFLEALWLCIIIFPFDSCLTEKKDSEQNQTDQTDPCQHAADPNQSGATDLIGSGSNTNPQVTDKNAHSTYSDQTEPNSNSHCYDNAGLELDQSDK